MTHPEIIIGIIHFVVVIAIPFYVKAVVEKSLENFLIKDSFQSKFKQMFYEKLNKYVHSIEFEKDVFSIISAFNEKDKTLEMTVANAIAKHTQESMSQQQMVLTIVNEIRSNIELLKKDIATHNSSILNIISALKTINKEII